MKEIHDILEKVIPCETCYLVKKTRFFDTREKVYKLIHAWEIETCGITEDNEGVDKEDIHLRKFWKRKNSEDEDYYSKTDAKSAPEYWIVYL